MASSALIFGILINVAILLVFFRFLMQLTGVSPYNPVVYQRSKRLKLWIFLVVFFRQWQKVVSI